jgi:hypothetical protein
MSKQLIGINHEWQQKLKNDSTFIIMDPEDPIHDEKLRYLKSVKFDSAKFIERYDQTSERVKQQLEI